MSCKPLFVTTFHQTVIVQRRPFLVGFTYVERNLDGSSVHKHRDELVKFDVQTLSGSWDVARRRGIKVETVSVKTSLGLSRSGQGKDIIISRQNSTIELCWHSDSLCRNESGLPHNGFKMSTDESCSSKSSMPFRTWHPYYPLS